MKNKKEFIIPWIQIDESIDYGYRPAMSFKDFKKMLGIDLLKFKKVGCDILIDKKTLSTLTFMKDWIIYNGEPYLTNQGIVYLFRDFKFIYLKFFDRYSRFVHTNSLSNELNKLLEFKKRCINIEKQCEEQRLLRLLELEKIAKESEIHNEYIKEFIPNFFENSYKNMEVV